MARRVKEYLVMGVADGFFGLGRFTKVWVTCSEVMGGGWCVLCGEWWVMGDAWWAGVWCVVGGCVVGRKVVGCEGLVVGA